MRRTVKGLSRMALLALVLALGGCKVELYTGISQKEGNEMLALLRSEGVSADKQADKDGTVRLLVEESDIAEAVEVLKRKGYPRENFSTLKDVFPKDGLISSPIEERARLNYAKAQEISHTLSEIDGVLVARVHVVLPEERDGLGRKSSPASASVFIKHAADVQLDAYVPQIKQLVNNGIEGLSYDRISVVLVPSAGVRQVPLAPRFESVFSIQVAEHSRGRLLGLFGLLLALLLASNLAQFFWHRQRGLSGAMPLTAYQLRFCPARYIHESHLPAVLLRLLPALPDWRRQSVLNAWLLEQLELDCAFRMPAQLGGLALYPQAALERTLGWLGALLHGQALRQVLDGARVRRIRAQIGEQGQRFCLEQLDLLIGRWPPGWQRALPENPEEGYFRRCGLAFWLAACSDADCGFSRRLRLRLEAMPAPADWTFDEQRRSLARTLCLKVARQASDECFHLLN